MEMQVVARHGEVIDVGLFVEDLADPVAAVVANDRNPVLVGVGLAGNTDVVETAARAHGVDPGPHRFEGELREARARNGGLSDHEHAGGVAVVAVLDGGDVDVDDVAVLEFLRTGDPVADDVIDGNAGRGGVRGHPFGLVAEAGGNALLYVHRVVVGEFVEFLRRDAGLHEGGEVVEKFRSQAPRDAKARDVFGSFDGNGHREASQNKCGRRADSSRAPEKKCPYFNEVAGALEPSGTGFAGNRNENPKKMREDA